MCEFVDLCWAVLKNGQVVFWPVFRLPGKQRRARLAFDHPSDAAVYGLSVQARYESIWLR